MTTPVWIVSGFLGAGKTTLIRKILQEEWEGRRIAVIENDFGEIRVDEALLADTGVIVSAIRDGCICCTLTGDFVEALLRLVNEQQPEAIVIEPSGVGMLSDVTAALDDERLKGQLRLESGLTVVDAVRLERHWDNFGAFFEDQIRHADQIVLSHTETAEATARAKEMVRSVNETARIYAGPWDRLNTKALLRKQSHSEAEESPCSCGCHGEHGPEKHSACCGHGHSYHEAEHETHTCGCGHDDHTHGCDSHGHHHPDADEIFERLSLPSPGRWEPHELTEAVSRAMRSSGQVLRIKGLVEGDEKTWLVQAVPGKVRVEPFSGEATGLVVIGVSLDRERLTQMLTAQESARAFRSSS